MPQIDITTGDKAPRSYDLIVIGSGAGGLSAAVTAAHEGLKVLVVEKACVMGGTSAWSGGWIFAPRNPLARRAGINEVFDAPKTYLRNVIGPYFDEKRVDSFLRHAPHMVDFFEKKTSLCFEAGNQIPDTYSHQPGAGMGGRSVIAAGFDAKQLGKLVHLLRRPLKETAFWGMTIQAGADLRAFMTVTRSSASFRRVTKRFLTHLKDLAFHKRGMQLRNGNALIARLIKSADDFGVDFLLGASTDQLIMQGGKVRGIDVKTEAGSARIEARRGVVLATGGFSQNKDLVKSLFPSPQTHKSLAVSEATGDGRALGLAVGVNFSTDVAANGAWCPVSIVPYGNAPDGVFPHIIERGKPGIIGVNRRGERFCNEGQGYHDYVTGMLSTTQAGEAAESWLISTYEFQRKYGLGISRPTPVPLRKWVKLGYVVRAKTITELADLCGIDRQGLERTITQWNLDATHGNDSEFHRGANTYQRFQGDAAHGPNPCVAPIDKPPFLAVRVVPGSFGCFAGLQTDEQARCLGEDGAVIDGLFAVGGDTLSVFGGFYPAGGINLGPAMTFGYVAGRTAAGLPMQDDIDA